MDSNARDRVREAKNSKGWFFMKEKKPGQVTANICRSSKGRWNWSLFLPDGSTVGGTKLGTMREAAKALVAAAKHAGVYNVFSKE